MNISANLLQSYTFHALNSGPRLLVLGAVHGNEKCGTEAIKRVIAELQSGALVLENGQVTFVPICNPKAYALDVRQTERNLNRYLVPMAEPDSYEARLGNVLCPLLADCDVLLDIHSYTVGGAPFALVRDFADQQECALAAALGVDVLLTGWSAAYAASGRKVTAADENEAVGTTEYARRFGAIATTLECGQHKDPNAVTVAYQALRQALAHLGLTASPTHAAKNPKKVRMFEVVYCPEGGKLARVWENFAPLAAGTVIATSSQGDLRAAQDCVIIMPKASATVGEEWYYLGEVV